MDKPRITVVIPTRDRCDVLESTLQTVVTQDYDNLDILVSDNFSKDSTEAVVRDICDPRIRYVNTGKRVCMSHNWEFALSNVSRAGWLTIIGDDDGLLPGAIPAIAEIIGTAGVRAIRTSVCEYAWPSLTGKSHGKLVVPLKRGAQMRDSRQWISKVLSGKAAYTELPVLYNGGFVEMELINQLRASAGCIYRSCAPDVFSAMAISGLVDRYLYLYEPTAINGASSHSTGTSSFTPESKAGTAPATIFASESNIPFHRDIPLVDGRDYPKSIQVVVYESYLQSDLCQSGSTGMTHEKQLAIILATAGRNQASINDWGRQFARLHSLDYEAICSEAKNKRVVLRASTIAREVLRNIEQYHQFSAEIPIADVFEAAAMAHRILIRRPSLFSRFGNLIFRVIGLSKKWLRGRE